MIKNLIAVLSKKPFKHWTRRHSSAILGIETSCDDTGCAIISQDGKLLGEHLHSQNLIHLRHGGIIPDIAQDLHRHNIESVVAKALENASMSVKDVAAIAVTTQPGLPLSLAIGLKYAKHLARQHNKPLIPIHHMEAHALAARMLQDVPFPFLVLLISGGHCLLAVAEDINKFKLLGESIDSAPGEIFDKVARRIKLRNRPEFAKLCGGKAIELAASRAPRNHIVNFPLPLSDQKDCNFSFTGLRSSLTYHLLKLEKEHETIADELVPEVFDLCYELQKAVAKHLVHRTQRAMEYCDMNNLLPKTKKQLVVSGGVACNDFIFNVLKMLCDEADFEIVRPPPKLCTDNGVMIAWNGLEKWRQKIDIKTANDFKNIDILAVSPLGQSLIADVQNKRISMKVMKLKV